MASGIFMLAWAAERYAYSINMKAGGLSPTLPTYMSRLPARDEDGQEIPGNDDE